MIYNYHLVNGINNTNQPNPKMKTNLSSSTTTTNLMPKQHETVLERWLTTGTLTDPAKLVGKKHGPVIPDRTMETKPPDKP